MKLKTPPAAHRLIAIVLPDLGGGGTERVHLELAREFIAAGYGVEFVLLKATGALIDQMPPGASVHDLGVSQFRYAVGPLRRYLSNRRPAFVMAAMWPLTAMTLLATRTVRPRPRVLLSEHVDFAAGSRESWMSTVVMRHLGKMVYSSADAVVCVSAGAASALAKITGLPADRIRTVYNPVRPPETVNALPKSSLIDWWLEGKHRLITAGRLTVQKDQATLLRAMALIPQSADVRLLVAGDGPERDNLEKCVVELGLTDRVKLTGFVRVPDFLDKASLFVLSSQWEGMAVVLVEALLQGVPVVSTDCPSGPAEVLEHGRYGMLVPVKDPPALAAAILASLASSVDNAMLQRRGAFFDPFDVAQRYLTLLDPTYHPPGLPSNA